MTWTRETGNRPFCSINSYNSTCKGLLSYINLFYGRRSLKLLSSAPWSSNLWVVIKTETNYNPESNKIKSCFSIFGFTWTLDLDTWKVLTIKSSKIYVYLTLIFKKHRTLLLLLTNKRESNRGSRIEVGTDSCNETHLTHPSTFCSQTSVLINFEWRRRTLKPFNGFEMKLGETITFDSITGSFQLSLQSTTR